MPGWLSGFVFIGLYAGVKFFAWIARNILKIVGAIFFDECLSIFLIWIAEIINAFVLF